MNGPDPVREILLVSLQNVRAANFWSRGPVTRVDLRVGAYDEISSADVPGFTDLLVAAFPGLVEHHCSVGERGGFIARLRDGTYAPHIIEHLALELQGMIGHDVAFGRARGGDRPGEYTVVFRHRHADVGLRAAAHALDCVQRAFAGRRPQVEPALRELRRLAEQPDWPLPTGRVLCGITGSGARAEVRDALARRWDGRGDVVEVSPGYLLNAGLPYARSRIAVVLGTALADVPERYRDAERAAQLVSVVADALPPGGIVIVPAAEREVQDRVRAAGCRVALFFEHVEPAPGDRRHAHAIAYPRAGRIVVERDGATSDGGPVAGGAPVAAQLVAALGHLLRYEMEDQDERNDV
jgi:hypothetical protein